MSSSVLAVQLYTVRDHTKTISVLRETLKKVAAIGYTAVQTAGFGPMKPQEIADAMAENGLAVVSTHGGWPRFLNEIDAVIEEHKMLRCKHPAIGALAPEFNGLDGLKRFLDELGPVAERLAAEGMDFSYHNHSHELVRHGEKTWLEALYEQAPASSLKAEIDTYWIQHGGENPAEYIRKYANRAPLIHLKDMLGDEQKTFAEVGNGILDWPAIFKASEAAGAKWYIVEQDRCQRPPLESVKISFENLKKMKVV